MSEPGDWFRVRDLFERAMERDPAELDAWLAREASGDYRLIEEVRSLLAHHTRAGSFLSAPVGEQVVGLLAETPPLQEGQQIGPYTVEREVGRGGMGRVYLAHDTRLNRTVALKALSPELTADPAHRNRLRREARAAAALAHPGICTIYALEEFGNDVFIATEFLEGRTLREEIGSGRRPDDQALLAAAHELAAALGHAHSRGVTHRDLKPENVMRGADGRLKILDFGLALLESPAKGVETRVTAPGVLLGTPAYMAPEQITTGASDPRVDVFAYGVLLYEYACGEHPFAAASPLATLARIVESEPSPLAVKRSGLPAVVSDVIDRCLRKAPEARSTASEILELLDRDARPVGSGPLLRWWRSHQLIIIALYFVGCFGAWQVKEWMPGSATILFIIASIAASIAGVFRGHLLFTERLNRDGFAREETRATPVILGVDLLFATTVILDGLLIAAAEQVAGVLMIALGLGVALARLLVEPATTRAAFRR